MKLRTVSKFSLLTFALCAVTVLTTGYASAHVVTKPETVLSGAYQTFTTSVPNEKDIPTIAVRLVIPEGVESVTPTVKQGWEIDTKKLGDIVTEITWSGGSIGAGLRDEFTFSAKAPAKSGEIVWKAYQTYEDGTVVAWDQEPTEDHGHASEDENKGPYSLTEVNDDEKTETVADSEDLSPLGAYIIAAGALVLAVAAFARSSKQNR